MQRLCRRFVASPMGRAALGVVCLVAVAACSYRGPQVQLSAAALQAIDPVSAKAFVHAAAVRQCGSCHQSTRSSAKPAALAIYNLDAAGDWSATLSASQLEGGFTRRLRGSLDDDGRSMLAAFVAHEVAQRAKR
jgi:hypothetical protein